MDAPENMPKEPVKRYPQTKWTEAQWCAAEDIMHTVSRHDDQWLDAEEGSKLEFKHIEPVLEKLMEYAPLFVKALKGQAKL